MFMEFNKTTRMYYIKAIITVMKNKGYDKTRLKHNLMLMKKDDNFLASMFQAHCMQ